MNAYYDYSNIHSTSDQMFYSTNCRPVNRCSWDAYSVCHYNPSAIFSDAKKMQCQNFEFQRCKENATSKFCGSSTKTLRQKWYDVNNNFFIIFRLLTGIFYLSRHFNRTSQNFWVRTYKIIMLLVSIDDDPLSTYNRHTTEITLTHLSLSGAVNIPMSYFYNNC